MLRIKTLSKLGMNGDPAPLRLVWTKVIGRLDHSLKKKLFSGSISFSIILTYSLHSDKHGPYIHLLGGFFLGFWSFI